MNLEKTTMTDARMVLLELVEQEADADLAREMLAFAAERVMELETEGKTGAPAGARSPDRLNQRNGYRDRLGHARGADRAGDPEAREGRLLPQLPGAPGARPRRPWPP